MLWLDWTLERFVRRDTGNLKETPTTAQDETCVRADPRWMRLERAILAALAPFTEARVAVARALADLEPLPEGSS